MKNKILLLGGNGYIGCSVYDYFKNLNYDITNIDLCWFGRVYEETDVIDYDDLSEEYIQQYTHIILLAAHSTVSMCEKSSMQCFDNNVNKFIKLIKKISPEQNLLYASSAAIYGSNDNLVNEENKLSDPINFYDFTKFCNENIVKLYTSNNVVGLRFGSVGGFSKNFRNENLMNSITTSSLNTNKITISNPTKYRSILGMSDLCRSIHAIIKHGIKNSVYNLTSVNDTIINFGKKIQTISGCELEIDNSFQTDYSFNCSNLKFRNDYGFDFEDTVETIYNDIVTRYGEIIFNKKRLL
jgi:nucleoside-diphosphate-sugar epimerase